MVTTTNNSGERTSALHLAAKGKQWDLFKLLLPHVDVHLTHTTISSNDVFSQKNDLLSLHGSSFFFSTGKMKVISRVLHGVLIV